jgi:hypothetical protein
MSNTLVFPGPRKNITKKDTSLKINIKMFSQDMGDPERVTHLSSNNQEPGKGLKTTEMRVTHLSSNNQEPGKGLKTTAMRVTHLSSSNQEPGRGLKTTAMQALHLSFRQRCKKHWPNHCTR